MALIHQNLYQEGNLTGVKLKPYFEKLCRNLFDSYAINADDVKLKLNIEDLDLEIDSVIPLGLVANELISNALKHAFSRSITRKLERAKKFIRLSDDPRFQRQAECRPQFQYR